MSTPHQKLSVVVHDIWEEHLTWYYTLRASSLSKLVMIGIIHHILYFYFKTFVTGRLKSNLLSPLKLLVPGTRGGSKLLCEVYNSNFVLFTGWGEHKDCSWIASHCRGHVWGLAKFYFLRDSAQNILQISTTKLTTTLHSNKSLQYYSMK
jgi:hypothetical protein